MVRPHALLGAFLGNLLVALPWAAGADTPAGIAAYEAGAHVEAQALLQPQAESGDPRAQFYLGLLHAEGPEAIRDLEIAVEWFERAAKGGYAEAQFQIGMRYSVGLGTDRNLIEAYKWLRIAEQGLGTAAPAAFLQTFVEQISANDIAVAEEAVTAWLTARADTEGDQTTGQSADIAPASASVEPPPVPTVEAMMDLVAAYDCADLQASEAGDGTVQVAGVFRDDDDAAAFLGDVAAAFGSATVQTELESLGEPNCAAAAFIGPYRPDFRMVALAAADRTIKAGNLVVVELSAGETPRYLYVDYFQLDGTVIHLLPEAVNGPKRIQPGAPLRLGDGSTSNFVWRAAPPFGRELLAVLMSSQPLFQQPRPVDEPTEDYLPRLRARAGALGDALIADYLTITTIPGQP